MPRLAPVSAALCALAALAFVQPSFSTARFTAATSNGGNAIAADAPANYVRLWSQPTDPTGMTGYARRAGSSTTPAATGADDELTVDLGAVSGAPTFTRTLVAEVRGVLPGTATNARLSLSLEADPATGVQPITAHGMSITQDMGRIGDLDTTVARGERRQMNLTVTASRMARGRTYRPRLVIVVRPTGYGGTFLTYAVPIAVSRA